MNTWNRQAIYNILPVLNIKYLKLLKLYLYSVVGCRNAEWNGGLIYFMYSVVTEVAPNLVCVWITSLWTMTSLQIIWPPSFSLSGARVRIGHCSHSHSKILEPLATSIRNYPEINRDFFYVSDFSMFKGDPHNLTNSCWIRYIMSYKLQFNDILC